MPFAKSKARRSPLQRLTDQRRSLALAGLAAGAVFSAAILRRKRREGEAEFDTAYAEPIEVPTTRPESGPPAAADVPPPAAGEPGVAAVAAAATATQADPEAPETEVALNATTEPAPVEATPTSISDPTTGELSAAEASILAVLAQHGRGDDDRTAIAVATSLQRETGDVAGVLRKLSAEGVVEGELYTASGEKIWTVTERGVRRLGAQH